MDDITIQTKPKTMRELLRRWAEVEPKLCQLMPEYQQINVSVKLIGRYTSHHVEDDNLTNLDLAWLQFAVQQAIVARGWGYMLEYLTVHKMQEATVFFESAFTREIDNNPVEALLGAYLSALEAK